MLLTAAAFLTPIIGGGLPNDMGALEPGYVPTVQALFRGTEIAILQHAVLALLVATAFVAVIAKRKVLQVPQVMVSGALATFCGLLVASVFLSQYRWISETALAEWLTYGIALVTVVAGAGRKQGPRAILAAFAIGISLVALMGIIEWRGAAGDWRIFAGWLNPNALGGMLVIGLALTLGWAAMAKSIASTLLSCAGSAAIGFAIVLTGSKGSLGAAAVALIVFFLAACLWRGEDARRLRRRVAVLGALTALVVVALGATIVLKRGAGSPLARIANSGDTAAQSSEFRSLLAQASVKLVKDNPAGTGIGTFAFYSSKPGLTTRTELAHRTLYQLAVEANVVTPLVFLFLIGAWIVLISRNSKTVPYEVNLLRAGVLAAVLATMAHGWFESNIYYFGIGLTLFMLLGVGLQLSADAGAPEFTALPMRLLGIVVAVLAVGQLVFAGFVGKLQANVRYLALAKEPEPLIAAVSTLKSIAPFDGETWYRASFFEQDQESRLADLRRAASVAPSAKILRALARLSASAGHYDEAASALEKALTFDPNNLAALRQLLELNVEEGLNEDADRIATRMIEVEKTPYFTVRSVPEIIPTETYDARLQLVKTAEAADAIRFLHEAVDGYLQYIRTTVPWGERLSGRSGAYPPGYTPTEAKDVIDKATSAAQQARELYRMGGDKAGVDWATNALSEIQRMPAPQRPTP